MQNLAIMQEDGQMPFQWQNAALFNKPAQGLLIYLEECMFSFVIYYSVRAQTLCHYVLT